MTVEEQKTQKILEMDRRIKELEAENKSLRNCLNCKSYGEKILLSVPEIDEDPIQCVKCHDFSNWEIKK